MPQSRRRFLRTGTLTAVAACCALVPGRLALGQDLTGTSPSLNSEIPFEATQSAVFYYTRQTFDPYVGGVFTGRGPGGRPVELTLLGVTTYNPSRGTRIMLCRARKADTFSLTFRAERPLSELSSVHTLEHAALGKFDLFMTRTITADGVFYEAVISHAAN